MLNVTHDYQEAMQTGDRILVMNKEVIEASGTKKEIINSTNHFVRSFIYL